MCPVLSPRAGAAVLVSIWAPALQRPVHPISEPTNIADRCVASISTVSLIFGERFAFVWFFFFFLLFPSFWVRQPVCPLRGLSGRLGPYFGALGLAASPGLSAHYSLVPKFTE